MTLDELDDPNPPSAPPISVFVERSLTGKGRFAVVSPILTARRALRAIWAALRRV